MRFSLRLVLFFCFFLSIEKTFKYSLSIADKVNSDGVVVGHRWVETRLEVQSTPFYNTLKSLTCQQVPSCAAAVGVERLVRGPESSSPLPFQASPPTALHRRSIRNFPNFNRLQSDSSVPHPVDKCFEHPIVGVVKRNNQLSSNLHNIQSTFWHAVAPSSRSTYRTAWHSWLRHVASEGTDQFGILVPPEWQRASVQHKLPYSFMEYLVMSFMTTLSFRDNLTSRTVSGYVSGVKFMLSAALVDTSIFDTSSFIRRMRSGIHHISRIVSNRTAADSAFLPVTLDVIHSMAFSVFPTDRTPVQHACVVAALLAFLCLMRKSEYLVTKANHYLRSEDVLFVLYNPTSSTEHIIPSSEAHLHKLSMVREIIINIRSAKNDVEGVGHRFVFTRMEHNTCSFDIVREAFLLAQSFRPQKGEAFFTYRSQWTLSKDCLLRNLRKAAVFQGIDPLRITLHSLRIGGASALANAKFPDNVIQKLGRWKSLAFLDYLRLTQQACNRAMKTLLDLNTLTSDHIKRKHASVAVL